ncbi:PQQ-dependent dehydrogenase, methanol/ethanol family [Novosphingobium beihaiensis]|uniref:PQQ-dependent dehydrogenase, methanol/ethanol family n=1 Tax=Novosphingobium beihaiensis TaxID=2930389 RepID=A0ABT0BVL7_9SPHN|nr:PQQ-dependent dehydrogenase, methanol/ethanol family [Novosphingobium beihaiensis]MCJ2189103.1 PQQ-dependent dehydrogenase, methanol/ethanol family [Novosphingobium beihaiensis]
MAVCVLKRQTLAVCSAAVLMTLLPSCSAPHGGAAQEWPSHGGTDLEQRFSPLVSVDADNAKSLGLAWSFELDTNRGQEATPIVRDGVMYVSTAWSRVYALDAKSGKQLWRYDPQVPGEIGFRACCDVVNRGVAVADGLVLLGALDGRLIAIDAKTGKQVWSVQTTDPAKPYTITGAPRVFDGKVVIGNGGAEYGVRGYVTAYDLKTGKQVWRFYTVPGDPKAGPDGAASDDVLKQKTLKTWAGHWYDYGGGGTAWDAIVYDPELHQLYIGVGNGSPWNRKVRSDGKGDNLFLSSIVALDPDTGAYKWHYQETPGESWDFTATQPIILATLTIDGKPRKVLMQAPKNGFFYVIDRESGKLISAKNFVAMNWAKGVDMTTGRPIINPDARYEKAPFAMKPSALGGHNWQPMAYSPQTGLVYLPTYRFVMVYGQDPAFQFKPGTWNTAIDQHLLEAPDDPEVLRKGTASFEGRLVAWDPVAQKEVWSVRHSAVQNGGVLATAGGLVFEGTGSGTFEARRADNGKLVWQFQAQDGIIAAPVSYALDGVQYIAIVAGYGGGFGLGEAADTPTPRPNGRVLVFRLGGKAKMAPVERAPLAALNLPDEHFSRKSIDAGRLLYTANCYRCHGTGAQSAGVVPDLRRSVALSDAQAWRAIVIDGALSAGGMASFKAWLSPGQAEDIRAYVARKAEIAAAQEQTQGKSDNKR